MNVLLATTHPDLRLSLELLLSEEPDVNVVGTVSESAGLLALLHTARPEIVISDWELPGQPLVEILRETNQSTPQTKFIILVEHTDAACDALNAGADAVARKGEPPERLLNIFRSLRI